MQCGERFTTYERQNEATLIVIKKDKSSEPFDRKKLMRGLLNASANREVPAAKMEALIDEVESEIRTTMKNEVSSKVLGEMVLEKLRGIDDVAYIRFASVYRDFKDINEFQAALKGMS